MTHRVLTDKVLDEIPQFRQLLKLFVTPELIKWSGLRELYEKQLKATPVFSGSEQAKKRWIDLRLLIKQNNDCLLIFLFFFTGVVLWNTIFA